MSTGVLCITAEEYNRRVTAGENLSLIDVRTEIEFAEVHATPARNIPLDQLQPQAIRSNGIGKDATLAFICKSGVRGMQACETMLAANAGPVLNIVGGTDAWERAKLPVEKRNVLPLQRQVQIAAGLIVLVGAVLGFSVHIGFFGLCAFVGCGLVFAGVTGWCGMAMMLAKMPWNTSLGKATSCCSASSKTTGDGKCCAS